jgi:hypothetical protein
MHHPESSRAPLPGAQLRPLRLELGEASHLSWLLDSGLAHRPVAVALRDSWGLCPRHAWGLAALEAELSSGAVVATAALHAQLLARAARRAERQPASSLRRELAGDGGCLTCAHLATTTASGGGSGRAVERFPRFASLLAVAAPRVRGASCPACDGGSGAVCRPHVLSGVIPGRALPVQLGDLARRLSGLVAASQPLRAAETATWVEGLGWLAGWGFMVLLARDDTDEQRRQGNGRVPDAVMER